MKVLFLMILTTVFAVGHLISPKDFSFLSTETTPTVTMEETSEINFSTLDTSNESHTDLGTSYNAVPEATATAEHVVPLDVQGISDPSQLFGDPKSEDTFERGSSGFGLSAGLNDDPNIRIIALNNRLSLEPKKNNGWISWRLRPPSVNDGAAEMSFSIITCARGDRTGILMRSPDYNSGHGYYFSLSCEGTVSILRDSTVINTADARGVFKNSSGDVNVMTALVRGNNLTLVLNGESLLSVQDETYKEGFSGFFTAPQGQNTLTMDVLSYKEYYNGSVQ